LLNDLGRGEDRIHLARWLAVLAIVAVRKALVGCDEFNDRNLGDFGVGRAWAATTRKPF
jgi:hypothetical protein